MFQSKTVPIKKNEMSLMEQSGTDDRTDLADEIPNSAKSQKRTKL
jgi:hypothetical protein